MTQLLQVELAETYTDGVLLYNRLAVKCKIEKCMSLYFSENWEKTTTALFQLQNTGILET